MQRAAVKVDQRLVEMATARSNRRYDDLVKLAENLQRDPQLELRIQENVCVTCFYTERGQIVMNAFHHQPCGLCLTPQIYVNSRTDVLCLKCANEHSLCKHCGADWNLDSTREFDPKEKSSGIGSEPSP